MLARYGGPHFFTEPNMDREIPRVKTDAEYYAEAQRELAEFLGELADTQQPPKPVAIRPPKKVVTTTDLVSGIGNVLRMAGLPSEVVAYFAIYKDAMVFRHVETGFEREYDGGPLDSDPF